MEAVAVCDAVRDVVGLIVTVLLGVRDIGDTVAVMVAVIVREGVTEGVEVRDGVTRAVAVTEAVTLLDGVREPDAVTVGVPVDLAVPVPVREGVPEIV